MLALQCVGCFWEHLRDNGGECGRGSRCATDGRDITSPDDHVVIALGGDVRVGTAGFVVQAVELAVEVLDVVIDGGLLVCWRGYRLCQLEFRRGDGWRHPQK